jgi:hypothetical protein
MVPATVTCRQSGQISPKNIGEKCKFSKNFGEKYKFSKNIGEKCKFSWSRGC